MNTPRMSFSGANLELVHMAVCWAIQDVQSQIGSCPDVNHYADDLAELEEQVVQLERLKTRIAKKFPRPSNPQTIEQST